MGSIEQATLSEEVASDGNLKIASSWLCPGPADSISEDTRTTEFEKFMADLTDKEDAVLVMSGTMGNQIALRSHLTQPPHAILSHHQSHILNAEADGCAVLPQAHMQASYPANGLYPTLEDIKRDAVIRTITPLAEIQRISAFAPENDIKMHLDGARIWEAAAAGAGSLPEFLDYFDTAQMCFSKGLAAPIGSVIVGPRKTLNHCRWIRKMNGDGIRRTGVISAAALVAVEENFGRGPNGEGRKLRETNEKVKIIEQMWIGRGDRVTWPVETNMVVLDLQYSGIETAELIRVGKEEGLKIMGGRMVVHSQIVDEAVFRLGKVIDRVLGNRGVAVVQEEQSDYR